jgi:hypothetical protein
VRSPCADDLTTRAGQRFSPRLQLAAVRGPGLSHVQTVSTAEWEDFESGLAADVEEWLASHPAHPEAAAVREKLGTQRGMWLRGHRGFLGFAYLTLACG